MQALISSNLHDIESNLKSRNKKAWPVLTMLFFDWTQNLNSYHQAAADPTARKLHCLYIQQ